MRKRYYGSVGWERLEHGFDGGVIRHVDVKVHITTHWGIGNLVVELIEDGVLLLEGLRSKARLVVHLKGVDRVGKGVHVMMMLHCMCE